MKNKDKKEPNKLLIPKKNMENSIKERIKLGKNIGFEKISNQEEYDSKSREFERWTAYNIELFKRSFSDESIADEYRVSGPSGGIVPFDPNLGWYIDSLKESMSYEISFLESVIERLHLIPEIETIVKRPAVAMPVDKVAEKNVFIVHGHDNEIKQAVARFLEKIKLSPIILHEKPNEGKTIIEKFEKHSNVGYAVVILSPDDSCSNEKGYEERRARQNVILELGYFIGKLGRENVVAIRKGDIEVPSDILGVLYISYDENESWKLQLAKEMKNAGLDVDLNDVM